MTSVLRVLFVISTVVSVVVLPACGGNSAESRPADELAFVQSKSDVESRFNAAPNDFVKHQIARAGRMEARAPY
jgi:hypothetical protein